MFTEMPILTQPSGGGGLDITNPTLYKNFTGFAGNGTSAITTPSKPKYVIISQNQQSSTAGNILYVADISKMQALRYANSLTAPSLEDMTASGHRGVTNVSDNGFTFYSITSVSSNVDIYIYC